MQRRNFIRKSAIIGSSILTTPSILLTCSSTNSVVPRKSKVIIAQDKNLQINKSIETDKLANLLDNMMQNLFDCDDKLEPWKRIIKPAEVVGIKVNCLSGYGSSNTILVDIICERLMQAGVKAQNIIIWDRLNSDLDDGGFKINYRENKVRCFGNDTVGFEQQLQINGSIASLVTQTITRICDALINIPVLKDHSIAGITVALKNFFGAIHNPNKYHLHVGDPYIPDVYMLPVIRNKVRLTICDAINAQYEGGPSYMPQWIWPFNGLIASLDPVALDYTSWQIIEQKRLEMGKKSLKESGREPTYLATAADKKHQLGTNDPNKIELIKIRNS